MSAPVWCTIESDPGVFTELISKIGVKDVQVEEIFDLSDSELSRISPIYGLIFLFKYLNENDDRPTIDSMTEEPELFFAQQTITNSCATQAILSVLLNASEIDIGTTLMDFKGFTTGFSAEMKGHTLSNSEVIRLAHNSFSRNEPFLPDDKDVSEKGEAFHFVAYVPFNHRVYELDGLKRGPILLGEGDDWLSIVRPAIQQRIEKYQSSEIRFNLLAIIKNQQKVFEERLIIHEQHISLIDQALAGNPSTETLNDLFVLGNSAEELESQKLEQISEIQRLNESIIMEKHKFEQWKIENIRRRHNYIPFIVTLFQILAEEKYLPEMVERAKKEKNSKPKNH
jgi:ubiquitin carboxyl-terminal hydrolase L5